MLRAVGFLFELQLGNLRDMLRLNRESVSENGRDAYVQRHQLQQYLQIRDHAYADAGDPQIDLLFVHFPLPHPFAIYDRQRRDFTLSDTTSYADNLALVDRAMSEQQRWAARWSNGIQSFPTTAPTGIWRKANTVGGLRGSNNSPLSGQSDQCRSFHRRLAGRTMEWFTIARFLQ